MLYILNICFSFPNLSPDPPLSLPTQIHGLYLSLKKNGREKPLQNIETDLCWPPTPELPSLPWGVVDTPVG